eukprot:525380_1
MADTLRTILTLNIHWFYIYHCNSLTIIAMVPLLPFTLASTGDIVFIQSRRVHYDGNGSFNLFHWKYYNYFTHYLNHEDEVIHVFYHESVSKNYFTIKERILSLLSMNLNNEFVNANGINLLVKYFILFHLL